MGKFMLGLLIWPILFWDDKERLKPDASTCIYFGFGVFTAAKVFHGLIIGEWETVHQIALFMFFGMLVRNDIRKQSGKRLF